MKKKLMALGMAAVLAFGAAGCGGGTDAKTGLYGRIWTDVAVGY